MKRTILHVISALMVLAMAVPIGATLVQADDGVEVQFAVILDGSGSISAENWTTMVNGLAAAVEDPTAIPQDGSVELTVIQFGGILAPGARVEVDCEIIDEANAHDVADQIRDIQQMRGLTPLACAIYLAADTLKSCSSFDASIKQAINLVTDGEPNRCCNYDSDLYAPDNECPPGTDFYDSVVAARDYLIATLQMTDGQDEIDIEGIGLTEANLDWLMDSIAWPEPGYIAPPFTAGPGWVRQIASFQEFADTISEKFEIVLSGSITAHKFNDLNGDGEQDTGEVNLEGWTMTLYEGSECTGDPLDSGTTGSDGNVVFTDLEAGIYFVKETLESGWTNTTPLCQQTIITTGDHTTLYFGNFEIPPTQVYISKRQLIRTQSQRPTP